jgi:hypothetical protein
MESQNVNHTFEGKYRTQQDSARFPHQLNGYVVDPQVLGLKTLKNKKCMKSTTKNQTSLLRIIVK